MFHEAAFFQYLAMERRFSAHTLRAYQRDLTFFIQFLEEHQCLNSVSELRHLHVRSWIVSQLQAGLSPRSVNRRLSCLKSYCRFLQKRGWLDHDPLQKIVAPRQGKRLPVFLQEDQLRALLEEKNDFGSGFQAVMCRTVLELLYGTGLRRSEATGLTLPDIDLERNVLRIRGKGNKERLVPIARYLRELLDVYLEERRAAFPQTIEKALFLHRSGKPVSPDNLYYLVRKHLARITSAEKRSPHVLRHSFATHLSNRGADLNAIKELLGHANLAATQVYTHNSIEQLLRVYQKAHPKGEEE